MKFRQTVALMLVMNKRAGEEYPPEDHQAIHYAIGQRNCGAKLKWKTKNFDKELFIEALRTEYDVSNKDSDELKKRQDFSGA